MKPFTLEELKAVKHNSKSFYKKSNKRVVFNDAWYETIQDLCTELIKIKKTK